jgi:exodeoxyribonuclease VII small subunit
MLETLSACTIQVNATIVFALPARGELSTLCREMSAKKSLNLEKSLADLESLVDELESGDLPLEKAMQKFVDGIKLTRQCQAALKEAEQKVSILMQSAGGEEILESFDPEDD